MGVKREKLAGTLLGVARNGRRERIPALARTLFSTEGWGDRYSEKDLAERLLPDLVEKLETRLDMAYARELVDALVDDYENFSTAQAVLIPVLNLTVQLPIHVGGAVLREIDDGLVAELESSLRKVISEPPNQPGTADLACERLRGQLNDRMGQVVAEIWVTATQDRALVQGRERYAELLDFLNGAATILYTRDLGVRVGSAGELAREIESIFVVSHPSDSFRNPMTWRGPRVSLNLDDSVITELQESGYWGISDVLAKAPTERTELESALLTALHWYAEHTAQTTRASQLLSLTIAAETIFPRRRSAIGFSCAEGIAFALAEDPERRLAIRRFFQDHYSKRGDIAHRGRGEVTDGDIHGLANLVMGLLLVVARKRSEFSTRADFEHWIDGMRLA